MRVPAHEIQPKCLCLESFESCQTSNKSPPWFTLPTKAHTRSSCNVWVQTVVLAAEKADKALWVADPVPTICTLQLPEL